jgi:hypothetical protein
MSDQLWILVNVLIWAPWLLLLALQGFYISKALGGRPLYWILSQEEYVGWAAALRALSFAGWLAVAVWAYIQIYR